MTGDAVVPPRMRVPVTCTLSRVVMADVSDALAAVLESLSVFVCVPLESRFGAVVSWAHTGAAMPAAPSKAMEMALRNVLVFMCISPQDDPSRTRTWPCVGSGKIIRYDRFGVRHAWAARCFQFGIPSFIVLCGKPALDHRCQAGGHAARTRTSRVPTNASVALSCVPLRKPCLRKP